MMKETITIYEEFYRKQKNLTKEDRLRLFDLIQNSYESYTEMTIEEFIIGMVKGWNFVHRGLPLFLADYLIDLFATNLNRKIKVKFSCGSDGWGLSAYYWYRWDIKGIYLNKEIKTRNYNGKFFNTNEGFQIYIIR